MEPPKLNLDAVLCYVHEPWAYFTTCALDQQWGDDWDDAPYEHNAGEPYEWAPYREMPPYEIFRIAYEGDFATPADGHLNSSWSVQSINEKKIAWLRPTPWSKHAVHLFAGTSLREFTQRIQEAGGIVYLPQGASTLPSVRPPGSEDAPPTIEEFLALRERVGPAVQALWDEHRGEEAELMREILVALRRSLGITPQGKPLTGL